MVASQQDLELAQKNLRAECSEIVQSLTEVQGFVVLMKVQVAKLRERKEHLQKALERLQGTAEELRREDEAREAELLRTQEEKKGHQERGREVANRLRQIRENIEANGQFVAGLTEERGELSRQVAAWEEERSARRSGLERFAEDKGTIQIEAAQGKMEMERLRQDMWDRYGVDLEVSQDTLGDVDVTPEDHARLEQLKEDLRRLGEVNLDSISELGDLQARQGFLSAQKDDLEKSLADLSRTVTQLNWEFRTRFMETFEELNGRLSEVFPKLFSGGRASLILIDPDNVLESGVDIVAQPPGKKLQSIGLLSGGEKALTALSLIFSVFLIKPAPFCLLDEVDAALDDANIDRFNEMVREMSTRSQIILVTHNKKTMELAQTLYGVTMPEAGKSKIVSVSME